MKGLMTLARIRTYLAAITYKGWGWGTGSMGKGFYIQARFMEGEETWSGRKWYISSHATGSEVVQTALKAVLTAEEHEAREKFLYLGKAIFGPHLDVEALAAMADETEVRA